MTEQTISSNVKSIKSVSTNDDLLFGDKGRNAWFDSAVDVIQKNKPLEDKDAAALTAYNLSGLLYLIEKTANNEDLPSCSNAMIVGIGCATEIARLLSERLQEFILELK